MIVAGTGHPTTLRVAYPALPFRWMTEIACPACGEDEDLRGRHGGAPGSETITVPCQACEMSWVRDLAPTCPTCGTTDVRAALQSIVDKSRGTQLSIQSMRVVHLCPNCDGERLAVWNRSNTPLRPDELPYDGD